MLSFSKIPSYVTSASFFWNKHLKLGFSHKRVALSIPLPLNLITVEPYDVVFPEHLGEDYAHPEVCKAIDILAITKSNLRRVKGYSEVGKHVLATFGPLQEWKTSVELVTQLAITFSLYTLLGDKLLRRVEIVGISED